MKKKRSPPSILASGVSINSWRNQMPSVEEARPPRCPCCGVPSRPVGKPLNLHGHGQRERQVRGPLEPEGPPVLVMLMLRRYLCQRGGATMTVGPKGLSARGLTCSKTRRMGCSREGSLGEGRRTAGQDGLEGKGA